MVEEMEEGDFLRVQRGSGASNGAAEVERKGWEIPQTDFVKINVDAGEKEGVGVSVCVVCRDDRGRVLWDLSMVQDLSGESHVAEESAVYEGISEASKHGHTKIVVESGCLTVIEALKRKAKGRSMFSLILDDILCLCNSFSSVLWSYTSLVNNTVAHSLAHILPRVVGRLVWSDVLPPIENNVVNFDSRLI
ncbi:uncharacterized protein LOC141630524 [Silene latifolia]|uniref:uncharacterized protein LOC141630524 n=1 Tax=Silene latifolia TaxID=37657 RepID=UPI003D78376A